MANSHLVILKKPYLDAILSGRKKVESRFTRTRPPMFGRLAAGDRLFLKISSGSVCATASIGAVKYFENLTKEKILEIRRQYNKHICGDDEYWQSKPDSKFGFLVRLRDVEPIEPIWIHKKDWRAWVVLTEKDNFGLFNTGTDR